MHEHPLQSFEKWKNQSINAQLNGVCSWTNTIRARDFLLLIFNPLFRGINQKDAGNKSKRALIGTRMILEVLATLLQTTKMFGLKVMACSLLNWRNQKTFCTIFFSTGSSNSKGEN